MTFTDEELQNLSNYFNKMVLPANLLDLAERLKNALNPIVAPIVPDTTTEVTPEVVTPPIEASVAVDSSVVPVDTAATVDAPVAPVQ